MQYKRHKQILIYLQLQSIKMVTDMDCDDQMDTHKHALIQMCIERDETLFSVNMTLIVFFSLLTRWRASPDWIDVIVRVPLLARWLKRRWKEQRKTCECTVERATDNLVQLFITRINGI